MDRIRICICTLIMDEHDYIEEWIDFYNKVFKINKFFLYEDYFSKSHKELLAKYGDTVILTPLKDIELVDDYKQYECYPTYRQFLTILDFYKKHKDDYDYVLFIDPDEYLERDPSIFYDEINKYKDNKEIKYIRYQWQLMKSNGLIKKPNYKYSVVSKYCKKANDDYGDLNINFKCCFFLRHLPEGLIDKEERYIETIPHGCACSTVNKIFKHVPLSKLRLRHYLFKSFEEYANRLYLKGEQNKRWARNINLFFEVHKELKDKEKELLEPYKDKKVKINSI